VLIFAINVFFYPGKGRIYGGLAIKQALFKKKSTQRLRKCAPAYWFIALCRGTTNDTIKTSPCIIRPPVLCKNAGKIVRKHYNYGSINDIHISNEVLQDTGREHMGLHYYLQTVRKLNNMGRWSTDFMHQRATVSEHSFFVSQVGQMLALIEEQNGNEIDWRRLFKKLLNHDVVEAMTGDIISTVKHKNEQLRDMLNILEKEVVEENLLVNMEEPYKSIYRNILFDGKDDTIEGRILICADYIDAIMECVNEVRLNNIVPFVDKYYAIVDKLCKSDLVSAKYFIDEILPELVKGCASLE